MYNGRRRRTVECHARSMMLPAGARRCPHAAVLVARYRRRARKGRRADANILPYAVSLEVTVLEEMRLPPLQPQPQPCRNFSH